MNVYADSPAKLNLLHTIPHCSDQLLSFFWSQCCCLFKNTQSSFGPLVNMFSSKPLTTAFANEYLVQSSRLPWLSTEAKAPGACLPLWELKWEAWNMYLLMQIHNECIPNSCQDINCQVMSRYELCKLTTTKSNEIRNKMIFWSLLDIFHHCSRNEN